MASTINAKSTGSGSLESTADASGVLALQTGGVTALTIDASQRVGIGTTTPSSLLNIYSATTSQLTVSGDSGTATVIARYSTDTLQPSIVLRKGRGTTASPTAVASGDNIGILSFQGYGGTNNRVLASILGVVDTYTSDTNISSYLTFNTSPSGAAAPTERMRIDSSGNLLFNSGYGSVATAYGCRAWVNFNGTGVVAIRASGNVSSITDNGTGEYTINFTTTLTDANYATVLGGNWSGTAAITSIAAASPTYSTSAVKVQIVDRNGTAQDISIVSAAIIR